MCEATGLKEGDSQKVIGLGPLRVLGQNILEFVDGQRIVFVLEVHQSHGFVGLKHLRPVHQDQGQLFLGGLQLPGQEIDNPHFVVQVVALRVLLQDLHVTDQRVAEIAVFKSHIPQGLQAVLG
jgi:hypothetical protein